MILELDDNGCIEVAFNTCYGGFSISEKAILRMIELDSKEAKKCYDDQQKSDYKLYDPDVPRWDPILIQVIKELKNNASGECASLAIGRVNLLNCIDIKNYDGKEDVANCWDEERYGRNDDYKKSSY